MKTISLLIADDHKMFREGLTSLLNQQEGIQVLADAGNSAEIEHVLQSESIDVVLMDIDMGNTNGIEMTAKLRQTYPEVKVLALSMHGEKNYILKMLEAGASGYILKNAGKEEIVTAVQTVASGNTYFSSQVSAKLLEHLRNPRVTAKKKGKGIPLTDREIEVLQLIAEEYSNAEIAGKLFISIRTVDTHRRNLLDKLGVKNTAGLVKYAIQNNLID